MPPIVAAAAAAAVANAGVTSLIVAQIVYAAAYAATVIVGSAITSSLVGKLSKKPQISDTSSQLNDRTLTVRQPTAPRRVIYGNVRVGGIYTFLHVTGSKNEYLNMVITISGHQIQEIEKMYFDGVEVPLRRTTYESWSAKSFATGTIVYYNGKYYSRTSTAYSQVPNYYIPVTDTTYWTPIKAIYTAVAYVAGTNYSTGSYVYVAGTNYSTGSYVAGTNYSTGSYVAGTNYYQRTAIAYPNIDDVTQNPLIAPTLWTEITISGLAYEGAGKYDGYVHVEYNLGTDDQAAFAGLITEAPSKWGGQHRQRGCAGAYIRLKYDDDVFPSGVPTITFLVKGKNDIYDPRDLSTGYSTNSALCAANYLADTRYGLGAVYDDEIVLADLIEAANICDEDVTLAAGGTEKRYATNGTFDCDQTPYTVLQGLTGAMAGSVITQGLYWYFRAGAWRTPEAITITDSEVVGAMITNTLITRSELFNTVKGTFISPNNAWQETDFPSVSVPSYVAADSGDSIVKDVALQYTTSQSMCQRICRIMLEETRRQITVTLPVKTVGYQIQPWDIITLDFPRYGWNDKTFQVRETKLNINDDGTITIDLSLKELDANAYAWDSALDEGQTIPANTTSLPSAFSVSKCGLTASDDLILLPSGDPATNLTVNIIPPNNAFTNSYEVQYKKSTDTDYILMGKGSGLVYSTTNVEDGETYNIRAKGVNTLGASSEWTTINYSIVGQLAIPPDVTGFGIAVIANTAYLSWNPVNVADLKYYVIKYYPEITGASWANSTILVDKISRNSNSITVPALAGVYLIKAYDYGGRESENALIVTNDSVGFEYLNAITSTTQEPTWAGVKDKTIIKDGDLQLGYASDIFNVEDMFSYPDLFLLNEGYEEEGTYYFDDIIDLSEVYTSRLTATLDVQGKNDGNDFFSLVDIFAVPDIFLNDASMWGAKLYVSITNDDPNSSPVTWSAWKQFIIGDYTARAFKFKLVLTSSEFGITPVVSGVTVVIDMPDRIISGKDITVPVTGLTVNFNPDFKALKSLTLNGQGLQTGDYYVISNKDETGFDIVFKNSGGSAVQRTMDYKALGYGRIEV